MSGRETPRRLARIVYCSSQRPITVPSLNFAPMNEAAGEPSVIGFTRTVTSAPGGNVLGAPLPPQLVRAAPSSAFAR